MHEVTSPVFGPLPPATSQIGRLLGQIHVPQSMTDIIIFVQSFSIKKQMFESSTWQSSYPEIQHLKNPPFLRHFLAKLLNSAFRQSFQTKLGSTVSPDPGDRWTKSIPQVFFQIFTAEILGDEDFYLEMFRTFSFIFCHIIPNFGILEIEKILKGISIIFS